jgi:hypothetical protein
MEDNKTREQKLVSVFLQSKHKHFLSCTSKIEQMMFTKQYGVLVAHFKEMRSYAPERLIPFGACVAVNIEQYDKQPEENKNKLVVAVRSNYKLCHKNKRSLKMHLLSVVEENGFLTVKYDNGSGTFVENFSVPIPIAV